MVLPSNNRGIALAAAVILITFAAIAILGVTVFVVQRLRQVNSDQTNSQAVYLAQAGIEQAIYNYRFRKLTGNGYFSLGQTFLDANNFFVIGGSDADLLMINTSAAATPGNKKSLQGLQMQNATNTKTITLDQMVVSWINGSNLRSITINGTTVWSGNAGTPVTALIRPQVTLNTTPTLYPINSLTFQSKMDGATINVRFVMTDGSYKDMQVFPATSNFNFTVSATGKTTGSNIYRTIQAVYNSLTSKITTYTEINNEITP